VAGLALVVVVLVVAADFIIIAASNLIGMAENENG